MAKKKIVVETKYTAKGVDDVKDAYQDIGKEASKSSEDVEELNESIEGTGEASEGTKKGLGGMLDGFKAIVMNPIGVVLIALVGAIKFVTDALESSEGASNKLSQGFSYLKGFIVPLQKAVVKAFNIIADAVSKPGKTWDKVVKTFEDGVKYMKKNVIAPLKAGVSNMALNLEKQFLKIRIAINDALGNDNVVKKLKRNLRSVEKEIKVNQKIISDASKKIKEDITDGVNAVVDGVKDYVKEADALGDKLSALTKREQQLLKARRLQSVQNAKDLSDIEKLKLIRDNEAQSLEDRIKANERIGRIEKKRVKESLSLISAELKLTQDRIRLEGDSTDLLDKEAEQLLAIQELRGESAGIENEQVVNKTALLTEEFDKRASLIDKEKELLSIREKDATKLADAEVQAQIDKLEALKDLGLQEKAIFIETQNALELAQANAIQTRKEAELQAIKEKEELDKKNSQDAIKLASDTAKQKADLEQALNNQILNFANSLSTALGEESKTALAIQKTVALAQIGIDTAKAISSLVASSSANPANAVTFGGAGAIQFATGLLQIGSNLAQAYSILKQPAPQLGGGSASGGGSAPSTGQTTPDLGFNGESAGTQEFGSQIIKAYVTESDITTSQTNANNIQQLSQIG